MITIRYRFHYRRRPSDFKAYCRKSFGVCMLKFSASYAKCSNSMRAALRSVISSPFWHESNVVVGRASAGLYQMERSRWSVTLRDDSAVVV